MSEKLFSVIIPLFNAERYIRDTIQSVLEQSERRFELIVVNDGSTDASLSIVQSIKDDRIRIINKKNTGVSDTRNEGMRKARGEFVAFLDADDFWFPNHLEEALCFFRKHPKIQWYAPNSFYIKTGEKPKQEQGVRRFRVCNFYEDGGSYLHSSCMVIRKDVIRTGVEYPVDIANLEDYMFQSKIALKFPEVGINEQKTSIYYQGTGGASFRGREKDLRAIYEQLILLHLSALEKYDIRNPYYPKCMAVTFLKSCLFRLDLFDFLSKVKLCEPIIGQNEKSVWGIFARKAYATVQYFNLQNEMFHFVNTPLKKRLSIGKRIMLQQGMGKGCGWFLIVGLYALRGIFDWWGRQMCMWRIRLHHNRRILQE